MDAQQGHVVAIFGGAVAGAEAAELISRQGIRVVVFEQNTLPFGKIEDGLPMWHVKLRNKEEQKIIEKLDHQNVKFVPNTKLGVDISFEEIVNEWGFSAVLLATGAWRDRPLPIEGIDAYVGRGLYYQNPFFRWFNHAHDNTFDEQKCEIKDGAIVVGGGLASIDVAKALMVETVRVALAKKGKTVDLLTIEKDTPAKVLAEQNMTLGDLGLKGCILVYRRQAINMPITPIPEDADERRIQKAYEVRLRMIRNLQENFLFKFVECHMPVDKIVEDDQLVGLTFQKTKIEGNRVVPIDGAYVNMRTNLVISSIGSVPERIPGMPFEGSVFKVEDEDSGKLTGYDNVYLLGNAVTGKGNIKVSRKHGSGVAELVAERVANTPMPSSERVVEVLKKVVARQVEVGYAGTFPEWAEKHMPVRYENLI